MLRYNQKNKGLLSFACHYKQLDLIKRLLLHPDTEINKADDNGNTQLHISCVAGNQNIVETLLRHPGIKINQANNTGDTPLLLTCVQGNQSIVETLLRYPEIKINQANNGGLTPLNAACMQKDLSIVETLLQHPQIKIDTTGAHGAILEATLFDACKHGRLTIIQKLLPHLKLNAHKKAVVNLYLSIKQMECYGNTLCAHDRQAGETAKALAQELHQEVNAFFNNATPNNKPFDYKFILKFTRLLHSQDHIMNIHRATWKPILANILFALTGIGMLAIAIRSYKTFISSNSYTWNDCLFFGRTNREKQIAHIEKSLYNCSA